MTPVPVVTAVTVFPSGAIVNFNVLRTCPLTFTTRWNERSSTFV